VQQLAVCSKILFTFMPRSTTFHFGHLSLNVFSAQQEGQVFCLQIVGI